MDAPLKLSFLDRSVLREGQTAAQALRDTVALAQEVERLGYHRIWVSEHHGVPGIAGSAPTVLAAAVAAATTRIRVGTGGVMLPNHRPMVVAEQFAVLGSLFPGRIDMGLGRSVGFTRAVQEALGHPVADADGFPEQLAELLEWTRDGGSELYPGVRLQPADGSSVAPFVLALGAGARIAAEAGLPVVVGTTGNGSAPPSPSTAGRSDRPVGRRSPTSSWPRPSPSARPPTRRRTCSPRSRGRWPRPGRAGRSRRSRRPRRSGAPR